MNALILYANLKDQEHLIFNIVLFLCYSIVWYLLNGIL